MDTCESGSHAATAGRRTFGGGTMTNVQDRPQPHRTDTSVRRTTTPRLGRYGMLLRTARRPGARKRQFRRRRRRTTTSRSSPCSAWASSGSWPSCPCHSSRADPWRLLLVSMLPASGHRRHPCSEASGPRPSAGDCAPHGGNDLAADLFKLLALVAVHEVDVQLVHARVREDPELLDDLVDLTRARRTDP